MGEDAGDSTSVFPQRKGVIADRESTYHARRKNRMLSPERVDAFAKTGGDETTASSYADVMRETMLDRERHELQRKLDEQDGGVAVQPASAAVQPAAAAPRKRSRWDQAATGEEKTTAAAATPVVSAWEAPADATPAAAPARSRWDATPVHPGLGAGDDDTAPRKRSRWDQTPVVTAQQSASAWEQTPQVASGGLGGSETPRRTKSRWDETPVTAAGGVASTPVGYGGATPLTGSGPGSMTPGGTMIPLFRTDPTMESRNRPLTDEELDTILPSEGYKILEPPPSYQPIRTPARKLMATPMVANVTADGFFMQPDTGANAMDQIAAEMIPHMAAGEDMPFFKPNDLQFFGKLLDRKEEADLSLEEAKERKIMRLLLRIKNGMGPERKVALKQIADKARDFGAGPLFNQILPLLMVGRVVWCFLLAFSLILVASILVTHARGAGAPSFGQSH